VRKDLELMIGKGTSKFIRKGRSAADLSLLYVFRGVRRRYGVEMSQFRMAGRLCDLLFPEPSLAATIIQHFFRSNKVST
jgi:hypothetical protein